jgi:hypothetical protein
MCLVPKGCGNTQGIDPEALPPETLIAAPMQFAVVVSAEGHCETVADFPPHRSLLCKLDVVRV